MAVLETKFSIWDRVRDKLTGHPVHIVGLQIFKYRPLSTNNILTEFYIVEDHTVHPVETLYRGPNELEKVDFDDGDIRS